MPLYLAVTAILYFLIAKDDPVHRERKAQGTKHQGFIKQLAPLKHIQVWRFAFYYFFVFGGYVALALWLPRFYIGAYGLPLATAGLLTAVYALPGSIFRALGGWLSDKIGARSVMYWTFGVSLVALFFLSYPSTNYSVAGIDGAIDFNITIPLWAFIGLTIVLGFMMSLGKAAVYKHIPVYYPDHVGAVGGMVGLIGGLGGFFMPIAFGVMNDMIGVWTSCFMLLTLIVAINLIWMHIAIQVSERAANIQNNVDRKTCLSCRTCTPLQLREHKHGQRSKNLGPGRRGPMGGERQSHRQPQSVDFNSIPAVRFRGLALLGHHYGSDAQSRVCV